MTREEAIFCEQSYIGETNCIDCKYYGTDTCQSRESHKMAIKALEQEPLDGDYVSREKVKEILRSGVSLDLDEDKDYVCNLIDKLPSRK